MPQRDFTTVRDTGGADSGLARAIDEGIISSSQLIFGGTMLSQTGGHATLDPLVKRIYPTVALP